MSVRCKNERLPSVVEKCILISPMLHQTKTTKGENMINVFKKVTNLGKYAVEK